MSSARSINGWVFSEGLRGLTALSVAAWSALVIMLLVAGSTDALGFIAVFWGCEVLTVPTCPRRWACGLLEVLSSRRSAR